MTPQEKAKELIEKMIENSCTPHPDDYSGDLWEVHTEKAKQCALICVEEMIKEHTWKLPMNWNIKREAYWQSVKEALKSKKLKP